MATSRPCIKTSIDELFYHDLVDIQDQADDHE